MSTSAGCGLVTDAEVGCVVDASSKPLPQAADEKCIERFDHIPPTWNILHPLSLSLSLFYRSFSISAGARACDWTMDGRAECREARCSNTVVAGAAPLCQQVLMPGVIHTFTDRKISVCRPAAVPYRWSACGLRHTDRFVVHERWHYSCGILQPGIPSSIPSSTSLPWSAVRCSPFWLTNNTFHARFRAYETHTNFYLTKNGKYIDRHNCSAVLGITFCCYLLR